MNLSQTILSKLRRSDLFVENRSAQASQLRRSGIFGIQRKDAKAQRRQGTRGNFFAALRLCALALKIDAAPPELENFLRASATKIPRLRRCESQRDCPQTISAEISAVAPASWSAPVLWRFGHARHAVEKRQRAAALQNLADFRTPLEVRN